jgi:hypothetical protein
MSQGDHIQFLQEMLDATRRERDAAEQRAEAVEARLVRWKESASRAWCISCKVPVLGGEWHPNRKCETCHGETVPVSEYTIAVVQEYAQAREEARFLVDEILDWLLANRDTDEEFIKRHRYGRDRETWPTWIEIARTFARGGDQ